MSALKVGIPIVLASLFPLILWIGRLTNGKHAQRWQKAHQPLMALVFAAVAAWLLGTVRAAVSSLISGPAVSPYIEKALDFLGLKDQTAYILELIRIFVLNLGLALAYVIYKNTCTGLKFAGRFFVRFPRWIMRKLSRQDMADDPERKAGSRKITPGHKILSFFYDFDTDPAQPYIRVRFVKIAKTFLWAAYLLLALCLAGFVFMLLPVVGRFGWFPYDLVTFIVDKLYIYPALSLPLLFEIADFLDGLEAPEGRAIEDGFIYDEETGTREVVRYQKTEKPLSAVFEDRFVRFFRVPQHPAKVRTDPRPDEAGEAEVVRQIRRFMRGPATTQGGDELPENYGAEGNAEVLRMITELEAGRDCLADATLENDLGDAFMLYLNMMLARGENVLVLCADDREVEGVSERLKAALSRVNGFSPVFIVRGEDSVQEAGDVDVLVSTPSALLSDTAQVAQEQFLGHVSVAIVPNTVKMLLRYAGAFSALERVLQTNGEVRFLFLNEGMPSELRNTLENMTGRTVSLFECSQTSKNTCVVLWNSESRSGSTKPQQRLFGREFSAQYLGFMMPLALVCHKLTGAQVILQSDGMPFYDIRQFLQAHSSRLKQYFADENGAARFLNSVFFTGGTDARLEAGQQSGKDKNFRFPDDEAPVVVMEDENRNLPAVLRRASHVRSREGALVHILSGGYLLRDYFQDCIGDGQDPVITPGSIVPLFVRTDAMKLEQLLSEMAQRPVPEETVMKTLREVFDNDITPEEALKKLRRYVLVSESADPLQYDYVMNWQEDRFNEKEARFEFIRTVQLRDGAMKRAIHSRRSEAMMELMGRRLRLGFAGCNLYQRYLPGQCMVYAGRMLRIERIDLREGMLYACAAPENMESPVEYMQNRIYSVFSPPETAEYWQEKPVYYRDTHYTVHSLPDMMLRADTEGYYALLPYDAVVREDSMTYVPLTDREKAQVTRTFTAPAAAFCLKAAPEADTARSAVLLAAVLQELCKTFFPYSWQEIAVCPFGPGVQEALEEAPLIMRRIYPEMRDFPFAPQEDEIGVVFLQDSMTDNGLSQTFRNEVSQPASVMLRTALGYLEWLRRLKTVKGTFFSFGGDALPACFDLDGLTESLRHLPQVQQVEKAYVPPMGECCCYCGKELYGVRYFELADSAGRHNRKVCADCHGGLVSSKEELDRLFRQAVNYMSSSFDAHIPENIKVRFASAKKIRKKMGTGDKRSVLGFAYVKKNEIWVETQAPEANILQVLVHELTHVWQNNELDFSGHSDQEVKEYKEGHSSFMEVRFLMDTGRHLMAERLVHELKDRQDEYGKGFRTLLSELDGDIQDSDPYAHMLEKFPRTKRE